jgi:hypothetical protein
LKNNNNNLKKNSRQPKKIFLAQTEIKMKCVKNKGHTHKTTLAKSHSKGVRRPKIFNKRYEFFCFVFGVLFTWNYQLHRCKKQSRRQID